MRGKNSHYPSKNLQSFILNRMKTEKADGFIKRGTFSDEIVWGNNSYIFSSLDKEKRRSFNKSLFLFTMVKKDARLYLKKNKNIKLPKKYPQIEFASKIKEDALGDITGTDLNHAYWRIAYNLGIISLNTYEKGLNDDFKSVRLSALSTLGANKTYQKIKAGELINEYLVNKGDDNLKKVYILIRFTCYKYMNKVKKMLGDDFLCYKTDCLYYIDTKENRKMVTDFFKEQNLEMKQLV